MNIFKIKKIADKLTTIAIRDVKYFNGPGRSPFTTFCMRLATDPLKIELKILTTNTRQELNVIKDIKSRIKPIVHSGQFKLANRKLPYETE